jgi:hypothetical protein
MECVVDGKTLRRVNKATGATSEDRDEVKSTRKESLDAVGDVGTRVAEMKRLSLPNNHLCCSIQEQIFVSILQD